MVFSHPLIGNNIKIHRSIPYVFFCASPAYCSVFNIFFLTYPKKKKVFLYVPDYGYDKYYLNLIWKLRLGMLCIEVNGLQTF